MNAEQVVNLLWLAGAVAFWIVVVLAFRARRRGGAYRAGVIGATHEWQSQDKRRAMKLIVEGRAEETDPEYAEGNLPDLERPKRP